MSGIHVSAFVNQLVPSFALNQKKEGEQSTPNWKVYAAAGTAIAFSALAANWAFSGTSNSNSDNDINDLAQKMYSSSASKNLGPELQKTATNVLGVIERVFADKKLENDYLLMAVVHFASEIDPMSKRFPGASHEEIALLSASDGIWKTTLEVDQANEVIKSIFDASCKKLNVNCDDLIKTLTARFNDSNLDKSVRDYIDSSRAPCQYPYCENWTPPNSKDLMEDAKLVKMESLRSDSTSSQSKLISFEQVFESYATMASLSSDDRDAGRVVLNEFKKSLDINGFDEGWASAVAIFVPDEIVQYKQHFPGASPNQIAVLAVLDSFITRLNMLEDSRDSAISDFMEENCKNSDIFKGTDKGFSTLFNSAPQQVNDYLDKYWRNVVSNETLSCENPK